MEGWTTEQTPTHEWAGHEYRRLACAMIIRAVVDYMGYADVSDEEMRQAPKWKRELMRAHRTARDWLYGEQGRLTFPQCCEAVGVEPEEFRRAIKDAGRVHDLISQGTRSLRSA